MRLNLVRYMKKLQKNPKVSIVILNHNTATLLKQCLSSIPKDQGYQIIVVDNDSFDTSVSMIKREFSGVEIVERKVNDGYTRGNNAARPYVKGEYVLFLNSDTKILGNALDIIYKYMHSHTNVGICTSLVELPTGDLYYACHRGFPTPWNSFCHFFGLSKLFPKSKLFSGYSATYLPLNNIHEIESCSGTFLMIRKELLDKIGWFDEDYYSFGEDIEMCFRVKALGYKVIFNPEGKIIHYWGASHGMKKSSQEVTTATREIKRIWANARFEAMKIFYDKHYRNSYPGAIRSLIMLGIDFQRFLVLRRIKI